MIAYEPVWAIGSGLTPAPADVAEVHGFIRGELGRLLGAAESSAVRILYGGSVKPANASELLVVPNVNGALVGGASLTAKISMPFYRPYAGRSRRLTSRPVERAGLANAAIFAMLRAGSRAGGRSSAGV